MTLIPELKHAPTIHADEIRQRFMSKVKILGDGCWQWQGNLDMGYGRFWVRRKSCLSHRVSYEIHIGEIPDGLQIDHLCRNRGCVNPIHLEAVTIKTNVLRGVGISAKNSRKTHCVKGHELSGDNLRILIRGSRVCKICQIARLRIWRETK